ncbi:M20 metallopeptidase family protein [Bhargavaea cecembensis]|uniref:M20 metallopeptidase family protein n=1 Tax=Bhargavaea cecembensis TaxID=394098 RepID=UPI000590A689|nr:amidohydrolase [Bhargavaea cecembensis]
MVQQINETLTEKVVGWRRHLHRHPELSHREFETANYIEGVLNGFGDGLEVSKPTATSVLAVLKGTKPAEGNAPVIAFRADIDALPIEEEADIDFRSENPGVMHACGHDCHPAMLLGAVSELVGRRDEFAGEMRFIFQHAEEVSPGGAEQLVEKGVIDEVDQIFALHIQPDYPAGKFSVREGSLTSAADDFIVRIIGSGGHASTPQLCVDPLAIGSEIVMSAQQIVSRKLPPLKVPVLTIATFHCGEANNVIASHAELTGTIRSHDPEVRVKARDLFEQVVRGITDAHGAGYELEWELGCPGVVNAAGPVDISRQAARDIYGAENVFEVGEPAFGTEDFAFYSEAIPASMQFIGVHNEDFGHAHPLHHGKMKVDESALPLGAAYYIRVAENVFGM